ncbi:MAG: Fic family protein [Actinobacteria bacterium]|nr:Fic family protein [Actinomycetota bacterium]MBU1609684.1 Fic family protein [Actinomycetota bacterium]MBU2316189.1 Fic family protein [Actinomycetota bacterium]MBU2385665.1 Fic family protein [Actinomycetota bacterium]
MADRRTEQRAATDIHWDADAVPFDVLAAFEDPLARLRPALPTFVWDAAVLEGSTFTLDEVRTLLAGGTVDGRTDHECRQVLALHDAFIGLDELVVAGTFALDKLTSDQLHGIVAEHEAIESGHFRGQGHVEGGGLVSLGHSGLYRASAPGAGGEALLREHRALIDYLEELDDPREQAIAYFCAATRRQFYLDGNKRTARLMMNGQLLAHGYDAISVSGGRHVEFNEHLGRLFTNGDAAGLMGFIVDSRPGSAVA